MIIACLRDVLFAARSWIELAVGFAPKLGRGCPESVRLLCPLPFRSFTGLNF